MLSLASSSSTSFSLFPHTTEQTLEKCKRIASFKRREILWQRIHLRASKKCITKCIMSDLQISVNKCFRRMETSKFRIAPNNRPLRLFHNKLKLHEFFFVQAVSLSHLPSKCSWPPNARHHQVMTSASTFFCFYSPLFSLRWDYSPPVCPLTGALWLVISGSPPRTFTPLCFPSAPPNLKTDELTSTPPCLVHTSFLHFAALSPNCPL